MIWFLGGRTVKNLVVDTMAGISKFRPNTIKPFYNFMAKMANLSRCIINFLSFSYFYDITISSLYDHPTIWWDFQLLLLNLLFQQDWEVFWFTRLQNLAHEMLQDWLTNGRSLFHYFFGFFQHSSTLHVCEFLHTEVRFHSHTFCQSNVFHEHWNLDRQRFSQIYSLHKLFFTSFALQVSQIESLLFSWTVATCLSK